MPDVSELVSRLRQQTVIRKGQTVMIDIGLGPVPVSEGDLVQTRNPDGDEAADTIESLQSTVSRLREALEEARETIASFDDGHGLLSSEETTITKIDEALKDIQSMKDGK